MSLSISNGGRVHSVLRFVLVVLGWWGLGAFQPRTAAAQAKWYTIIGVSNSTYQYYHSDFDAYVYKINITVKNTQTASTYLMAAAWCGTFSKYYAEDDEYICPNGVSGAYENTGLYLAPNQTATVSIPVFISAASGTGSVYLSVTGSYTGTTWPFHTPVDSKTIGVTVSNWVPTAQLPLEPLSSYAPSVTPKATSSEVPRGVSQSKTFTIQNTGTLEAEYALVASCGSMANCSATKSSTTLASGASDNVVVSFTTPSGLDVSNVVSLRATYTNANNQSIADTGSTTVVTPAIQPVVTPDGGAAQAVTGNGLWSYHIFTVTNNGTLATGYTFTPSCSGWASSNCAIWNTQTSEDGTAYEVTVGFIPPNAVGSSSYPTANVTLIATRGAAADTATIPLVLAYRKPSVAPHTATLSEPGNTPRTLAFSVTNSGNVQGSYGVSMICSGAVTECVMPNGVTSQIAVGGTQHMTASFKAPPVGSSGTIKVIAVSGGGTIAVEADTAVITVNGADQLYPKFAIGNTLPAENQWTQYGAISFTLIACDPDGIVDIPTINANGSSVNASFTSGGNGDCWPAYTSKVGTVSFAAVPGLNTVTFTVSDGGGHTTTVVRHFYYNELGQVRPTVTYQTYERLLRESIAATDTFYVQNTAPIAATYAVSAGCSVFPVCASGQSSLTLAAGQTGKVWVDYTTTATTSFGIVFPVLNYTGPNGSMSPVNDTYTRIHIDRYAPTITFQSPTPANGATLSTFPSFAVDFCDADGNLVIHSVTLDGTPLPANFTPIPVSGCTTAGSSSWSNVPLTLGTHTLAARATDVAGHDTTITRTFTLSLPAISAFQPAVTPKDATPYLIPTEQTLTWAVRNMGSLNAQYQLEPDCTGIATTCQLDKTTTTLAPGAVDSVRMTYVVSSWPSVPRPLKLSASYTDLVGRVAADTGTLVLQIPNVTTLYRPELPPSGRTLYFEPGVGSSMSIQVWNRGIAPVTYRMDPNVTGDFLLHSSFVNDTVTVLPGQFGVYTVIVLPSANTGATSRFSLTASATFNGQTVLASMTANLVARATKPNVSMAARGGIFQQTAGSSSVTFDVKNTGAGILEGTIVQPPHCASLVYNCRFAPRPGGLNVFLPAGAATTFTVLYDLYSPGPPNGYGGLVEINFLGKPGTLAENFNRLAGVNLTYVQVAEAISVTPDFLTVPYPINQDSAQYEFEVKNTGTASGVFDIVIDCVPSGGPGAGSSVTCQRQTRQISLSGGEYNLVKAWFKTTAAEETGLVTLMATKVGNSAVRDSGSIQVQLSVAIADISIRADTVNSGRVIARGECVTIAAGQNSAVECGDLRIIHPLPPTATMNKTRAPTLIYNSAHARGQAIIAANVRVADGITVSGLDATLSIQRDTDVVVVTRSIPWSIGDGQWHRIAMRLNASDLTLITNGAQAGVFKYTLEVKSSTNATVFARDNGEIVVVDRSRSVFGTGWWLDGYEQVLMVPSDTSKRLWIGGDGSARVYTWTAPNRWMVTPTVDRVDSLVKVGTAYQRRLSNGAYVEFDELGRHVATVNQLGHTTQFLYGDYGLSAIKLPVAGPSTLVQYTFDYDNTGVAPRVSSIVAPGARQTLIGHAGTTRDITSITDPGVPAVQFVTNASIGVIEKRYNRLNTATTVAFDSARLVRRVTIANSPSNIVAKFCAAEGVGLTYCDRGTVTGDSMRTKALLRDEVRTIYDGPRDSVADVTEFFVTRYGAPRMIIDAESYQTIIERRDTLWRMLPTMLETPSGHRTYTQYSPDRGLPTVMRDVRPLEANDTAFTYLTWHPKWDVLTGRTTPQTRDTLGYEDPNWPLRSWQQSGTSASRRVMFHYDPTTRLVRSTSAPMMDPDSIIYDNTMGNVARVMARSKHWTTMVRDVAGRDSITIAAVKANDLGVLGAESDRVKTVTSYDPFGRVLTTGTTSFGHLAAPMQKLEVINEYNAEGWLKKVTRRVDPDPNGLTDMITQYFYDDAGRRTSERAPDTRDDIYVYDPAGNVISRTSRTGATTKMAYDARNLLAMRWGRDTTYAPDSLAGFAKFPMHPVDSAPNNGVRIRGDTARFFYSALGAIVLADNSDAQVSRDYYPNGLLKREVQQIRSYAQSNFGEHVFTLDYEYDLDGRRTKMTRGPNGGSISYTYLPGTGELRTVTQDRNGGTFTYDYDSAGRVSTAYGPGGITETFAYDRADRLQYRTEVGTNYSQNPQGGGSNILHADTLSYDGAGKITRVAGITGVSIHEYTGLGAVSYSMRWRQFGDEPFVEFFEPDALGNLHHSQKFGSVQINYGYQEKTGRLISTYGPGGASSSGYDYAGNQIHRGSVEDLPYGNMSTANRSYYGPDGKLRVNDRRVNASAETPSGMVHGLAGATTLGATENQLDALEEYRYDALGRRVMKRSRKTTCGTFCQSVIERYVWDGDHLTMEMRYPGGNLLPADSLERWHGHVFRVDTIPILEDVPPEYKTRYFPQYGTVFYTHGVGMDRPLMIERAGFGMDTLPYGNFSLVPHYDYQGIIDEGTLTDGQSALSHSLNIKYAGRDVGVFGQRYVFRNDSLWFGGLMDGMRDGSGLQYRRNRYYDPQTGRFTQEDPIGLAGGMNLYGFAGGDPVNFSDPFGLSPDADGGECTAKKPCKIDKEKFVQWMRDSSGAKSKGRCANYCRRGMEAGGMNTDDRPIDAADYGPFMLRHGAKVVGRGATSGSPEGYTPQNGDVVVFDRAKGYNSGHIQVWIGDQWASDFKQGTQFIPKKGITWGYTIYRLP